MIDLMSEFSLGLASAGMALAFAGIYEPAAILIIASAFVTMFVIIFR